MSFHPETSQGGEHRTTVDCGWRVVRGSEGQPLLNLSTYGSPDRKLVGKASQVIQLDREMALELRTLIDQAFGL